MKMKMESRRVDPVNVDAGYIHKIQGA